ncbi:putative alpha-glucosidase [Nymphon striatum]|nr:putative alpha-glucosidase [Nymphon striatum]
MVGLPRDIIENARVDGATEFQIFVRIILPLSFPAIASFAIFQSSKCWAPAAATGKSWRRRLLSRSRCLCSCFSPCRNTWCVACWPVRSNNSVNGMSEMNAEKELQQRNRLMAGDADWWRGAVIYQIYPRSYQDSNTDGIGDIPGITRRLPYIASLGVDAIWISPFFTSPMRDFGYDVADYCDVDPMFGTLADFDALIETAHRLGVRVMIDLVLSHTSDQHPWFVESPWQWDPRREQYYLHNFLTSQPDLNFHTPAVQDALLDVARFWLQRGVDGFRLDTINFYVHDKQLRSNPPLPRKDRNASIAPSVNPYNHQRHLYSKNQPENLEFLRRFRAVLDEFPGATTVGEVGDAQRGLEIMGQYTSGDEFVHMCYAFELLCQDPLTADRLADVFAQVDEVASNGWACWAVSNHDVVRHPTRWGLNDAAQRLVTTLLVCLRGSVCFYQGRDGCRTPMVWDADAGQGGFSAGQPWLPVSAEHLPLAVTNQEADPTSLLAHYRAAIALRKSHPALAKGGHSGITADGTVAWFTRRLDDQEIFCAFNLGADAADIRVPEGAWQAVAGDLGGAQDINDGCVALAGWQPCILRRTI